MTQNGVDGVVELLGASHLVELSDDVSNPDWPPDVVADPRSSSPRERRSSPLLESICPLPAEALACLNVDENMPSTFEQKADDLPGLKAHGDRLLNNALFLTDKTCHLNNASVQVYGQILRAYPKMLVQKDQLPPVIHPWQMSAKPIPLPLANCITLV